MSDAVVATIAGHTHQNGYLVDNHNIHHLVMPAVLETPPGRDAYGWVEVHQDRLLLVGVDTCMSCDLKLQLAAVQRQQRTLQQLANSSGSTYATRTAVAGVAGADIIVEVASGTQECGEDAADVSRQFASLCGAVDVD